MKNTFIQMVLKVFTFFAISFITNSSVLAQNRAIDSLLKLLEVTTSKGHTISADTTQINILIELAEQFLKADNYEKAELYANNVIQLSSPLISKSEFLLKMRIAQVRAYNTIGKVYRAKNFYEKAIEIHNKALSISIQNEKEYPGDINNKRVMGTAYNGIGGNYYFLGILDKALEAFIKSLKIFEDIREDKRVASLYNNVGLIYQQKGDDKNALLFYMAGLNSSIKSNDKRVMASSYNNIGNVYYGKGEYETSIKNFKNASEWYDKSLSTYIKALKINTETGNENWEAFNYANIGNVYEKKGSYNLALSYYSKALKLRQKIGEKRGVTESYGDIGKLYLKQNKIAEAKRELIISLRMATDLKLRPQLIDAYLSLSECENKKGNYKEAYYYHEQYTLLKDTVYNEKSSKQIAEMQTKYETEKKEKENAVLVNTAQAQQLQINKQKTQRNILIGSVFVIFIFSGLLYNRNKIKQKALFATEVANQEKLRFKAMIEAEEKERVRIAKELHDGLGQLLSTAKLNVASLSESIVAEDKPLLDNSLLLIDDACAEVRNISHNMMPNALIRLGLIPALKEVVSKINDSHIFQINFTAEGFEERLNESVEIAFYRIIQEALNNIIKHSGAKEVDLRLRKIGNTVQLVLSDNGVGFDTENIQRSKGIGWKNIFSRVSMLNGDIRIDSSPGSGTQLNINIMV